MSDPINHPSHYTQGGIEVIAAIEAWQLGFHLGNVVKYIARAKHKGGLQDLQKAHWYLDRYIESPEAQAMTGDNDYQFVEQVADARIEQLDSMLEHAAASLLAGCDGWEDHHAISHLAGVLHCTEVESAAILRRAIKQFPGMKIYRTGALTE